MKRVVHLISLTLSLIFLCLAGNAQEKTITGTINASETNEPLSGVTVLVKKTSKSTITDALGNFSIAANPGQVLQFSYVGFASTEVIIGSENSISIKLAQTPESLNAVVIVGYGTQRKANLTGAVTTVDVGKTFGSKPLNDPTKALQGVVP